MKRCIGIFLLFVFAFNIVGVAIVFKVQQIFIRREIKRQIKNGISDDELHVIKIPPDKRGELKWKNDNEFSYQGSMFDIVRKEVLDDETIVYHCINDKEEAKLFANLDGLVHKSLGKDNPAKQTVKKIFKVFTLICQNDHNPLVLFDSYDSSWHCLYDISYYSSPFIAIKSPPPQSLFS